MEFKGRLNHIQKSYRPKEKQPNKQTNRQIDRLTIHIMYRQINIQTLHE